MKYKAEIFDKVQYLYEETKFNDHMLHSVIRFDGKLDADILAQSVTMLLQTVPILSCVYHHDRGSDYWESADPFKFENALIIVKEETAFNDFTTSKIDEFAGPQIKLCLYRSDKDSLSVIMNHMVCDAAGFKRCLYLLSDIYSKLMEDAGYVPDFKIDGDRSIQKVMKQIPIKNKIKSLLFNNSESNRNSEITFPLSRDENTFPFIATREIDSDKFALIRAYCKKNDVTINDVFLSAYYRALYKELKIDGEDLYIPVMVDMRRYLDDNSFNTISNISSTIILDVSVSSLESFDDTVSKIGREMNKKKSTDIGINGFVKLNLFFKLLNNKLSYKAAKKVLNNPLICMTNVGMVDSKKLRFKETGIENAFVCGSIKFRPHFQVALSSFEGTLTMSTNLYGSLEDYDMVIKFLSLVEEQLPV
jgi:NRPS condensation-like uncharacterized protein